MADKSSILGADLDPVQITEVPAWRYSLRTLFVLFLLAAVFLNAGVPFIRWLNSRPGMAITEPSGWPIEIEEVTKKLGQDQFSDLRIWHLYGGWFSFAHVWRGKATPEAVKCLQEIARMNVIQQAQVPIQFWNMPREWSEMPDWWDPKPVDRAEYYMSPSFVPRITGNDSLDCVAMYDPVQQVLYVWSQWDF